MLSLRVFTYLTLATTVLSTSQTLWAEGAPSPYDSNFSGAFVGAAFSFGQSRATNGSNPGASSLYGLELGYIAAKQSWNRIEASLEVGSGMANFKDTDSDTNVDLAINYYVLPKFGYAYAIGDKVFGVVRAGAGMSVATYPAKAIATSTSSETLNGFTFLLGYDVVFPVDEVIELSAGLEIRTTSFTGDDVESFQLNVPAMHVGARVRL